MTRRRRKDEDDEDYVDMDEVAKSRRWLLEEARRHPNTAWMVADLEGLDNDPFWMFDEDLRDVDFEGPF